MEWDFGRTGGLRRRGYLPHIDIEGSTQFITFKLFDALPEHVVIDWNAELGGLPAEKRRLELGRRVESGSLGTTINEFGTRRTSSALSRTSTTIQ